MDWYHLLTWIAQALATLVFGQTLLVDNLLPMDPLGTYIDFLFLDPPKAVTAALNWMQAADPAPLDLSPLDSP
ncbi:MAG: hypothetical protein OXG36_03655 [Caldilineaceae bacterium]|nr:hypothetical protein [Caldilineaceae bacterium]